MPFIVDGKKVILTETAEVTRQSERTDAGIKKRSYFQITIKGRLLAEKGSPTSSGTFWTATGYPPDEVVGEDSRLTSILTKQAALSQLLCQEGVWHEIVPFDGSAPTKWIPRISTVQFPPGQAGGAWFDMCDFTIQSEADAIWANGVKIDCGTSSLDNTGRPLVDEETWTLEQADEIGRTYRLSHSVSAQRNGELDQGGNPTASGWRFARDAVIAHLGFNQSVLTASGSLNLTGYNPYNLVRSVNTDETNNRYAVTESWLCFDPSDAVGNNIAAIDEYTVESRTSSEEGIVSVVIQGSIQGLMERDQSTYNVTATKWANASGKWLAVQPALYDRALSLLGITLSPAVVQSSRSFNPTQGTINYSYEYNSRSVPPIDGVVSISTQIDNDYTADVFAEIPVLARLTGPILQDMDTVTLARRTVSVECVLAPSSVAPIAAIGNYLLGFRPNASQVYLAQNRDSWLVEQGRYSRSITFAYGD